MVEMQPERKHVGKRAGRRVGVGDAFLYRPGAPPDSLIAVSDRHRRVLMPSDKPIRSCCFLEQSGMEGNCATAKHRSRDLHETRIPRNLRNGLQLKCMPNTCPASFYACS